MALDPNDLVKPIAVALKPMLGEHWAEAQALSMTEAVKLGYALANVVELYAIKKINGEQARALIEMQKVATQAVLLTVEGVGLLTAQRAVNSGLASVSTVVNKAVGFGLI